MNIGQKINLLFEHSGFKNYADWGKAMGLPSDWLLDLKRKEFVKTIDVTRLITIAKFNQITIDELLKDDEENYIIGVKSDLQDNDIYKVLNQIQIELQKEDIKFNGYAMSSECRRITYDAIDVLKGLVQSNL